MWWGKQRQGGRKSFDNTPWREVSLNLASPTFLLCQTSRSRQEEYGAEVVCMAGDVGQQGGLKGLKEKARASGAAALYGKDLRKAFVEEFILPILRSGAV